MFDCKYTCLKEVLFLLKMLTEKEEKMANSREKLSCYLIQGFLNTFTQECHSSRNAKQLVLLLVYL